MKIDAFATCDTILRAAGVEAEDYAKARGMVRPGGEADELLTPTQMMGRLRVAKSTFYGLKRAGMPCLHLGGRLYRFPEKKVMAWLAGRG